MPLLNVCGVRFDFDNDRSVILPDINRRFERILVIKGSIGSGKTLLLKTLAGAVIPNAGVAELDAEPYFVHSQPEFNFVTGNIGDELDFAGITHIDGFKDWLDRDVNELSGGELKRLSVMFAMCLSAPSPNGRGLGEGLGRVILLDEPLDMLDDKNYATMVEYIVSQSPKHPMIIATHSDSFDKYADDVVDISGGIAPIPKPAPAGFYSPFVLGESEPLLIANIKSILPGRIFSEISLTVRRGEIVCLYGANGSGKSLFVRAIAGINKFGFEGFADWRVERKKRGICLQFPEHMAYHETVADEITDICGFENFDNVMSVLGWRDKAQSSPFTLSDGEKRTLYIVSFLANADICVFDEPFAGLDAGSVNFMANQFHKAAETGKSVLYTANRKKDTIFSTSVHAST